MNEQQLKEVYAFISKTTLSTLSKEEFNSDIIFTFCLYLQLGVIKARSRTIDDAKQESQVLLDLILSNNKGILKEENGEELKPKINSPLVEICNDIWNTPYADDLSWLQDWIDLCTKMNDATNNAYETSTQLLDAVNDHLDFVGEVQEVTFKLIRRTLHDL